MDLVNRIQRFYDPNQQREQGRFADEGKGGKHPAIAQHEDIKRRAKSAKSDKAKAYWQSQADKVKPIADKIKAGFGNNLRIGDTIKITPTSGKVGGGEVKHPRQEVVIEAIEKAGSGDGQVARFRYKTKKGLEKIGYLNTAEDKFEILSSPSKEIENRRQEQEVADRISAQARQEFYNPDQLRDQGGKFADEGKGSQGPGYQHPDEAGLKGIDKRLVDYVAHRPLSRESPEVRSVGSYVKNMHYVPYSHTPFFDQLNKMQGTRDPMAIPVSEFAAARKALFRKQPKEKLRIKDLIATQPVVNGSKVQRNVDDENLKRIFVTRYEGKQYVMDGHHALMAAAAMGKKKIKARVLELVRPPKDDADLPRYLDELSKTKRYKEVVEHQKQYGATVEKRESWSKHINSDNEGNYTKERQALHQKIVASMINPKADVPKDQKPSITYLIGPPGAGKSSAGLKYANAFGPATYMSPDDIRHKFPEYNGMNTPATQTESKDVHKQLGEAALARHQNIIEDIVGSRPDKLDAQITEWGKAGYNVNVIAVNVPPRIAVERAWNRYQHTGRHTDVTYLLHDVDSMPLRSYAKVKENPAVKNWISIDNSGKEPKVTDKGHR